MINKSEVGNRIIFFRKQRGLSQTALAEQLNVTPQAVSKWETGLAVPDIETLLALSWLFKVSINEILEGNNTIRRIANRLFDMDDIAYFVPRAEQAYNIEWAEGIVSGNWIKKNWEWHKSNDRTRKELAKKITQHGGLILEIGTGPGGGFMPAILLENRDAAVIISDLSPTIVRQWKKLFENELFPPNVHYAALDNCDLPFEDNSIDVISSGGGFGNTEGDKFKVITEIYRVLKPGGLYVSGEGYVSQQTLKSFPEPIQKALLEKRPDLFEDFYDATATAGFKKIDNIVNQYAWSTKGDDSAVADLARELGIEIVFSGYVRYAVK